MAYIGRQQDGFGVRSRFIFTATGGQTTFTTDDSSNALSYSDGAYVDVYLNGVLLDPSDYTATSLTSIVLDSGASANDTLEVIVYDIFSVFSGTFTNGITANEATVTGDLTVDTNTLYVDSTNNRVGIGTSSPSASLSFSNTVGTAGDADKITLFGSSGDSGLYGFGISNNQLNYLTGANASHVFYTGGDTATTERMRIDSSGNVGIGTTSPSDYFSGADQLVISGGSGDGGITINAGTSSDSRIHFADGTSGSEAYRGIVAYDHANDSLRFVSSGSEAMRIDSSGRVLQGTSSAPLKWWNGTTYGNLNLIENNNQTNANFYVTQGLVRNTADSEAAQLGFAKSRGTTSGSATVIQNGDALGILTFQGADGTNYVEGARISATCDGTPSGNDMPTRLQFYTTADGNQTVTERMRISSAGGIGGRTTSPRSDIVFTSGTTVSTKRWGFGGALGSGSNDAFYIINEGNVGQYMAHGAQSWIAHSDERIKENITDVGEVLPTLLNMRCVKYNLISNPEDTKIGFIAQDWETSFPELIDENVHLVLEDNGTIGVHDNSDSETPVKAMSYTETIPLLLKAIQEQQVIIENLKSRIETLENA